MSKSVVFPPNLLQHLVKSEPDFLNKTGGIQKLQTTIIYNYKKTKENHTRAQIAVIAT